MQSSGSWEPYYHQNLVPGNHQVTSSFNRLYNCIAWAAEVDDKNYWPKHPHWPKGIRNELDLESFKEFYALFGFSEECEDAEQQQGFDKVAIYATTFGDQLIPTHASRQLLDGRWTSKMGKTEDIIHPTPYEVEGRLYGKVVCFLRRKRGS